MYFVFSPVIRSSYCRLYFHHAHLNFNQQISISMDRPTTCNTSYPDSSCYFQYHFSVKYFNSLTFLPFSSRSIIYIPLYYCRRVWGWCEGKAIVNTLLHSNTHRDLSALDLIKRERSVHFSSNKSNTVF